MHDRSHSILLVVFKNTSTFDFSIPLLWKIRQSWPKAKISVLYCTFDKRQIVRDASYYRGFFEEIRATEFDLGQFIKRPFRFLEILFRRVLSQSSSDITSQSISRLICCLTLANAGNYSRRLLRGLLARLAGHVVSVNAAMDQIQPDLVLLDHRLTQDFFCKEPLNRFLLEASRPVVLVPHAPHFIHETDDYYPFMNESQAYPEFAEYWMPFRYGRPWLKDPERRSQYLCIGYPGFDEEWSDHIREHRDPSSSGELRCLMMTRKFLGQGVARPEGFDRFTQDYEEVLRQLELVAEAIASCNSDIELWIKPHPGSNFPEVRAILDQAGLSAARIVAEPYYQLLPNMDLCVSSFSTSLLMPLFYGIPTLILNSPLQEYVHGCWEPVATMYQDVQYFVNDPENDLGAWFVSAVKEARQRKNGEIVPRIDSAHLREYFPDGALSRAMGRIEKCLDKTI
jgi:hypothetical protein